jgi:hypothetical protein
MGHRARLVPLTLAAVLLAAPLARASSYDEAVNGDLSGNRLAPSSLALTPGDNTVTGTVIVGDIDYLTITVPVGYALTQINLLNFVSIDDLAFIAIQAGSTFTQPPTGTDVTQLLGWAHFGLPVPAPYFAVLGTAPGAIGFTAPLPAGPYTLWIQQASAQQVAYTWDFVAGGAVPEPGSAALALFGAATLLARVADRFLGRAQ